MIGFLNFHPNPKSFQTKHQILNPKLNKIGPSESEPKVISMLQSDYKILDSESVLNV